MIATELIVSGAGDPPAPETIIPPDVLKLLVPPRDFVCSWWTAGILVAIFLGCVALFAARSIRRRRSARGNSDRPGTSAPAASRDTSADHRRTPAPAARGRHVLRWTGVAGLWTASGLCLVLGLSVGLNTYVGFIPNVKQLRVTAAGWGLVKAPPNPRWHPREARGTAATGTIMDRRIPGTAGEKIPNPSSWIYTPPGFDPHGTTRYPVVYLIHGSPGQPSDWITAGQLGSTMDTLLKYHVIRPMIVVSVDVNGVSPSARDTECLNSTRGGSQVETYVTTTVPAWVQSHYPVIKDRRFRAIGGMSSGGFCALNLGLRHTDLYSSILAIEPFGDPGSGGHAMLATKQQFLDNSPAYYIPRMHFDYPVNVFLDEGSMAGRQSIDAMNRLQQSLEQRGQRVESRIERGQIHNWRMAAAALPYGLVFADHVMPGTEAGGGTHDPHPTSPALREPISDNQR